MQLLYMYAKGGKGGEGGGGTCSRPQLRPQPAKWPPPLKKLLASDLSRCRIPAIKPPAASGGQTALIQCRINHVVESKPQIALVTVPAQTPRRGDYKKTRKMAVGRYKDGNRVGAMAILAEQGGVTASIVATKE
jgi:hypothetical protein